MSLFQQPDIHWKVVSIKIKEVGGEQKYLEELFKVCPHRNEQFARKSNIWNEWGWTARIAIARQKVG